MPRRCVIGCKPSKGPLHMFPNINRFPEQFKAWVQIVYGQDSQDKSDDYTKWRICDRHFTERDRNRNNRLNALAVPSLFLRENFAEQTPIERSALTSPMTLDQPEVSSNGQSSADTMAQWDPKGKTFLITGCTSGLGAEYAQAFLENGAKKVAILDTAEELGKATAMRLNQAYDNKVVFIKCDVSKEEEITSAFDFVCEQFKQLDVIINNADVMIDSPSMWRTASDINWHGVVSFTLKGVKHMRKDEGGGGGTIINIVSIMGMTKFPYLPIYCGSKMAVVQFSQCLAMDPFYENTGIRVMSMCLGSTDKSLVLNLETKAWDQKLGNEMVAAHENGYTCQKRGSAVAALLDMFTTGAPATIWLSVNNKPVKDITASIDRAFKDFENIISGIDQT